MPSWASVSATGKLFLDTLLWASVTLAFHGLSLLRLLWDERRVRFEGEDEEQVGGLRCRRWAWRWWQQPSAGLPRGDATCRQPLDCRPTPSPSPLSQLWRFFHRRSGMGRLEMKEVLRFGSWRRVPAGSPVLRRGEERLCFCLLVEGSVIFQPLIQGEKAAPTLMRSGSCFDIALLNVFGGLTSAAERPQQVPSEPQLLTVCA